MNTMILRPTNERGHLNFGWLDTYHTFSFGDYYDPQHMGFGVLRVINEDVVQPGQGFGTHPHRDMEIITYLLAGELEHRDSMGNGSIIRPGEIQKMSAGRGVTHSEFNHSRTEPVHLLQIWVMPKTKGLEPSYEQKKVDSAKATKDWLLLAAENPTTEQVSVQQDLKLWLTHLNANNQRTFNLKPGRAAWLHLVRGQLQVSGQTLKGGDALGLTEGSTLDLHSQQDSEVLLFEMSADSI